MTSLVEFLEAVATDPVLVDEFRCDPDGVLERYGVDERLHPLLKSGDDVALLTEVLEAGARDAAAGE